MKPLNEEIYNVAVVIPFKNWNFEIENAINSVLKQTNVNFRIFLIQNNSSDSQPDISFADKLNKKIEYSNLGVCANANVARDYGAKLALEQKFNYIAFLDADDYWEPDHLQCSMFSLITSAADLSFSSFNVNSKGKSVTFFNKPTLSFLEDLFINKTVDCRSSCLLLRSESYAQTGFDLSLNKHQDWGMAIDSFCSGKKIIFTSHATVQINTSVVGRMSNSVNIPASIYFADKKLKGKYKSNFLFSRLVEMISFRQFDLIDDVVRNIVPNHLNFFRFLFFYFVKLSPFFCVYMLSNCVSFYRKSFLVRNK